MGIFMPPNCSTDSGVRYWLVGVMVALTVAAIALLAQAALLWRRMRRAHTAWWRRLPLVLPVAWAGVCGLLAADAWGYYRVVSASLSCDPLRQPGCGLKGPCFGVGEVGGEAQFALIVAAFMLILGWLALATLARRTQVA